MIKVDSLSFVYPTGISALQGLSFSVAVGESVGIIGRNGAGKSTLVNHLNGVLSPSSGTVSIDGMVIDKKNAETVRKKVGLIFQNPDDMLFMPRIIDDIMFGPLNLGMDEHKAYHAAEAVLKEFGILDLAERPPYTLSQGQKRFAALAAVLVMAPSVLVLDEPTSDLDPGNRRKLINHLNRLSLTKVVVSHDLDFVWETCSRVLLLSQGRLVADGPMKQVLSDKTLLESVSLELPLRLQC